MDASIDKEAAALLNDIPPTGTTAASLAQAAGREPAQVQLLLDRLRQLRLVELEEETYRPTPFVQKARNVFKFVA